MPKSEVVQLDAVPLSLVDGELPTEFPIFKKGTTPTQKGTYLYDEKSAASIKSAEERKNRKPWMDYEHQSLHKTPIEAPAAAVYDLEYRDDGLYATNVKWRPRAANYLKGGEYLFDSPAFIKDTESGRVLELINVALTNDPATKNHRSLVPLKRPEPSDELAFSTPSQETKMSKAVIVALGCREDAEEQTAITAAVELSAFKREVISLTGRATPQEALGAITAMKASHEQVQMLSAKVAQMESAARDQEVKGLLDDAQKDGRVPPARVEELKGVAAKYGVEALRVCLSMATPVVPTTPASQGKPATMADAVSKVELTADAKKIAREMGIPLDEFRSHIEKRMSAVDEEV